jgi:hypothetical protein
MAKKAVSAPDTNPDRKSSTTSTTDSTIKEKEKVKAGLRTENTERSRGSGPGSKGE